jgi:micrococcal nuclease
VNARGGAGLVALLLIAIAVLLADSESGGGGDMPGREPSVARERAEVLRIVDGDTIEVEVGGTEEDVRYIGIDTPESVKPGEPVECFGPEASDANKELVEGKDVELRYDAELRDVYGRLLAYVYVDDEFVNAELVRGGYAQTLEIEPNTSQAPLLERLELEASREGRGLWGAC